jgi:hypothetical protein
MALMCTGCYKRTQFYKIDMNEKFHPYEVGTCNGCKGKVVEIDDLIVDATILLNQKGYKTKFTCSGHLDESFFATYIFFEERPYTAPKGFYIDDYCIRLTNQRNKNRALGFERLLEVNLNIYRWALGLPDLTEIK